MPQGTRLADMGQTPAGAERVDYGAIVRKQYEAAQARKPVQKAVTSDRSLNPLKAMGQRIREITGGRR